ncbi:uncharacterized protein LOC144061335 isoform X2 [Vanacampus margaritifer]
MEAELREPYDDCDLRGNKMRADPASDFPERSFMTDARAVPKSERLRLMSWNLNINRRKLFGGGHGVRVISVHSTMSRQAGQRLLEKMITMLM